jgi:hypothetical protein
MSWYPRFVLRRQTIGLAHDVVDSGENGSSAGVGIASMMSVATDGDYPRIGSPEEGVDNKVFPTQEDLEGDHNGEECCVVLFCHEGTEG